MQKNLTQLRDELSVKAKNGIDFITAGAIIWLIITVIWTLPLAAYYKGILTFFAGGAMFPMALLMSKVFKTEWKIIF